MDKTRIILGYLTNWQTDNYQSLEDEDVAVFNSIGAIVTLISNGLIKISNMHDFVTDILNLSDEEKEKVAGIIVDAYDFYGKQEEVISNG